MADAQAGPSRDHRDVFDEDVNEPCVKRRLYSAEVVEMWSLWKLRRHVGTRELAIEFAVERGLLLGGKECRTHRVPMKLEQSSDVGSIVCYKGNCNGRKISRANDTWFENVKISLPRVFYLTYALARRFSQEETVLQDIDEFPNGQCISRSTITDWNSYCRETVVIYQLAKQDYIGKIGSPGKVVQIDESKFGKRKYNRGRHVEGHWVLGLIEDGSEDLRLEVCPDNVRSAEVLLPLIQKHVLEGTTIHTDCWRAYDCLADHGYIHKKVNHSDPDNPFVAEDGTHTQRIESQWRAVKNFFLRVNYNHQEGGNFTDYIVEYAWRRSVNRGKKDPFLSLLKAIRYVYGVDNQ